MKENELDVYKDLCGRFLEKPSDDSEKNNEEDKENKKLDKTQNLLLKVLTHNFNKYGPINKIFTQTNSTEPERINIRKLANKLNLSLNAPNEDDNNNNQKNQVVNSNDKQNENVVEKNEDNEKAEKDNYDNKNFKWEFVLTEKPDKIDRKLEEYLKEEN